MGKTPSSRHSKNTRTVTNTCHERAYFDTALRAFLKDAAMSDDSANTESAPGMMVNSVNSEECAAPTRIFREAYTSISENSLAMPSHVQAQTIREICACLNTGLDGRSLPSWQSGIPFSSNVQVPRRTNSMINHSSMCYCTSSLPKSVINRRCAGWSRTLPWHFKVV